MTFGVVIACCQMDLPFAEGCCASIRHFLGDVPICLITDGHLPTRPLEKAYGVQVKSPEAIGSPELRKDGFGWGYTRMLAFWESPFERFLLLDADTIVWGDVPSLADFERHDVILDDPGYGYDQEAVNKWFFRTDFIERHFPGFRWQDRPFACPAVMLATRDCIPVETYLDLLRMQRDHPASLLFGDMGIANLMLFRAADEGDLRLGKADLQCIAPDFSVEELERRFPIAALCGEAPMTAPQVIHFPGAKPFVGSTKTHSGPMTHFRLRFVADAFGLRGEKAHAKLRRQDLAMRTRLFWWKLRKKLRGRDR